MFTIICIKITQLSRRSDAIVLAYNKGYKVIDGEVFYRGRKLKPYISKNSGICYLGFCIKLNKKPATVPVHRLVAYQKFGPTIFLHGLHVRHLDGNSMNNLDYNIGVGTASENSMDRVEGDRIRVAIYASSHIKKHDHESIIKMHRDGLSYKKIMEITGIKSKGTMSFIIKKSIASAGGFQPPISSP